MLKTPRLCIDLGGRQVEKITRGFEKIRCFLSTLLPKINENSSPKLTETLFVRNFDKKSLPGVPFGAKDRFLIDFWVPEGTPKSPNIGKSGIEHLILTPSGHPEAPQDAAVRLSDRFFVVLGASGDPPGMILDHFSQRFSKQNKSAFVLISGIS